MCSAPNRELENGKREVREALAIIVASGGQVLADGVLMQLADLEASLRDATRADPDVAIALNFGDGVQYGEAVEVLDLLDRLDFAKGGIRIEVSGGGSNWGRSLLESNDERLNAYFAASGMGA